MIVNNSDRHDFYAIDSVLSLPGATSCDNIIEP